MSTPRRALGNQGLMVSAMGLGCLTFLDTADAYGPYTNAQGPDIVPIPGTKRRAYLEENAGALDIVLTAHELADIEAAAPPGAAAGNRYPEAMMGLVRR